MDEDELREWVQEKLYKEVEPQKIREALEDHGYDASVVEEVLDQNSGDKDENSKKEVSKGTESDEPEDIPETTREAAETVEENLETSLEKTESISKNLENSVQGHRKRGLAVLILVSTIILSAAFLPHSETFLEKNSSKIDPANTSGNVSLPSSFNGEKVVLEDGAADPSRPSLVGGEKIAFVNKNPYTLEISFESGRDNITVKPMNYSIAEFGSTTYYTGYPEKGKIIDGSLYVE